MSLLSFKTNHSSEAQFRFDRVQRWLHWSMALLIFIAIGVGLASAYLPVGQEPRQSLLELHKSVGFTVLVLAIVRIAWRLGTGEPPYRRPLGPLTHLASRVGHAVLYGMMIYMPISGYLFSAAGGYSLPWFGLFQWPRLLPKNADISKWGELLHGRGAWIIVGIVALHLAAVVWHQWIKRDEVLGRMTG
jgi:cytochrome b561